MTSRFTKLFYCEGANIAHIQSGVTLTPLLPQIPNLKTLVKLGSVSDEERAQAKEYDVEILSWADFEVNYLHGSNLC